MSLPSREGTDPGDPLAAREQEVLDLLADTAGEEPMSVRVVDRQGVPLLMPEGEVDIYTAGRLESALQEALGRGASGVVVDLSRISYFDSSGLGVLVRAARQEGARVLVVAPQPRIARLFVATGLSATLPVHQTAAEALAALAAG